MATSKPPADVEVPAVELAPDTDSHPGLTSDTISLMEEDLTAPYTSQMGAGGGGKLGFLNIARKTLGLTCLLVTVFLWTTSNFLASYIFSDHSYDKPFFVVYVNTSIFALSMIPISIKYAMRNGGFDEAARLARQAWRQQSLAPLGWAEPGPSVDDFAAGERLLMDDEGSLDALDAPKPPTDKLSFRETVWLSFEFCMLWFFANYFASACLEYTSVSSVTILSSTSSVWTLLFGAVMRVEPFTMRKLVGVLASFAGIILISLVDLSGKDNDADRGNFPHKTQSQIAIGDSMALVSALVYGIYVTVMKQRVGNEDRVNMPLFFGLVGVINVVLLWPGFFVLHWTGMEPFSLPPTGKIWTIILLNSISSFISDMLWAYAMLLTTPLIVTVGLSLTIPLSLIGEMVQYQQFASLPYWVGAGVVLLSFLFVNHESEEEPDRRSSPGPRGLEV